MASVFCMPTRRFKQPKRLQKFFSCPRSHLRRESNCYHGQCLWHINLPTVIMSLHNLKRQTEISYLDEEPQHSNAELYSTQLSCTRHRLELAAFIHIISIVPCEKYSSAASAPYFHSIAGFISCQSQALDKSLIYIPAHVRIGSLRDKPPYAFDITPQLLLSLALYIIIPAPFHKSLATLGAISHFLCCFGFYFYLQLSKQRLINEQHEQPRTVMTNVTDLLSSRT